MNKDRETANKYRQQTLQGDLMAMNNMGICYAQSIGVVDSQGHRPRFRLCQAMVQGQWV